MFTFATAITRLTSGPKNVFAAGLTADQQMQRLQEVLERFYEFGTWRGVTQPNVALTSVNSVVTLPPQYQRIEGPCGLVDTGTNGMATGGGIFIKSTQWAYSPAGPGATDWATYWATFAVDMGDQNGQRVYLLTGDPATNDKRTLQGLCRLRYVWTTDTSTVVIPDSYQALRVGVYALGREDEGQDEDADSMFAKALRVLNGNIEEFEPEDRNIIFSHLGGSSQIQNLV